MASREAGRARQATVRLRTGGKQAHSARPLGWQGKACKDVAQCRNANMFVKARRQCRQTGWARQADISQRTGKQIQSSTQVATAGLASTASDWRKRQGRQLDMQSKDAMECKSGIYTRSAVWARQAGQSKQHGMWASWQSVLGRQMVQQSKSSR
jgi:hypothetical protein